MTQFEDHLVLFNRFAAYDGRLSIYNSQFFWQENGIIKKVTILTRSRDIYIELGRFKPLDREMLAKRINLMYVAKVEETKKDGMTGISTLGKLKDTDCQQEYLMTVVRESDVELIVTLQ